MTGKIFINYRRGDDPGNTGRLFDQLEGVFARDRLFMDVDSIPPGRNFVRFLEQQVAQCDVLLAVIGKNWIDARDEQGVRRLDKPDDFVRIEIESALKQDKLVIPVLVQDAHMPRPDQLPEEIRPLAFCNAVRLTHERFRTDAQSLIKAIQEALEEAAALRREQEETARKAQAEEDRRRDDDDARQRAQAQREADERARQEKEQARQAAIAGLSPVQIAKAEELANWDFIKGSKNAQDMRDHLARFPGGVTEKFAQIRLEELVWAGLGIAPTLDQLTDFLDEFPAGAHAKAASDRRAGWEQEVAAQREANERAQREDEAWAAASNASDAAAVGAFLKEWPQTRHTKAARARIRALTSAPTRRRLLLQLGGAAGLAAAGGATWLLLQPGNSLWRFLHDRSLRTFSGHSRRIDSVAFSPDGSTALSGSWDDTLTTLWEVATGKELRTFTGHTNPVSSVAFSPDGRTALSGSWDKKLKLWEVATGKDLRTFSGHSDTVWSVAFSPDGYSVPFRTVLSGDGVGMLKLWEVATGQELRTFTRHSAAVSSVAFAPDGRTALSGSWDRTLKLWEVATGKELRTFFTGHSDAVSSVAFAPNGRTALSGSWDMTLKLWEVATGKELRTFTGHSAAVSSVTFAPDGRTALSGSWDRTLKLWEVATGKELRTFTGHSGPVNSVAFSPDGRTALSGSYDTTLKLWDLTGL